MGPVFKNIILAGVGTLVYSYEKGSAIIEDLVKKGELTINEGKELSQGLKMAVYKDKAESQPVFNPTNDVLKEKLIKMDFVTKGDLDEIRIRLDRLEGKEDTL